MILSFSRYNFLEMYIYIYYELELTVLEMAWSTLLKMHIFFYLNYFLPNYF